MCIRDSLLADAFTKRLVEERGGRWPDHPRAWLYRVASNLAMSRTRRLRVAARVDRVLEARHRDGVSETPDAEVLRRERRSTWIARSGSWARTPGSRCSSPPRAS